MLLLCGVVTEEDILPDTAWVNISIEGPPIEVRGRREETGGRVRSREGAGLAESVSGLPPAIC